VGLPLVALIVAAGLLGMARSAGAIATLVVDDDGAECPSAGYASIDTAIAAASPGDTILVCPGTYPATTVDKRVSLVGYTQQLTKLSTCASRIANPADQTTKSTIVAGFSITADFVSIRAFTLTGAANGVLVPGNVNRATVTRNVIQDNAIGVNLNGTHSAVDHNCLRENTATGSASGTGIYSDQGLKSTSIDQNVFVGNTSAAITLLDAPGMGSLDAVSVTGNVSSGDGDLISIAGSTHSKISRNTSTGAIGSAIYLQAGALPNSPNSLLEISNNTLTLGNDEGIFADDDSLQNSTIKNNTATMNQTSGFHIATGTGANGGNTISKNDFRGNVNTSGYDCWDQTSGSGTAGTDNAWSRDKGKTRSPTGICKKK
jgi:nitrous oxidase accessory protein NosD